MKASAKARGERQSESIVLMLHVAFPIVLGGMIYLLFRRTSLLMFSWADTVGISNQLSHIRHYASEITLPNFAIYSLPDACWAYSMSALQANIWRCTRSVGAWVIVLCPPTLALLGEFGQLIQIVPGTFCWEDVGSVLCAFLLCTLLFRNLSRRPQ